MLPVPAPSDHGISNTSPSAAKGAGPVGMDVFESTVPIPMVVPGVQYGVNRPWFYMEDDRA